MPISTPVPIDEPQRRDETRSRPVKTVTKQIRRRLKPWIYCGYINPFTIYCFNNNDISPTLQNRVGLHAFPGEGEALLLQYGHGVGVSLRERPIISRRYKGQNSPSRTAGSSRSRPGAAPPTARARLGSKRKWSPPRTAATPPSPKRPPDQLRFAGVRGVLDVRSVRRMRSARFRMEPGVFVRDG